MRHHDGYRAADLQAGGYSGVLEGLRIQSRHDALALGARNVRRTKDASRLALARAHAARDRCAHLRCAEAQSSRTFPKPAANAAFRQRLADETLLAGAVLC